MMSLKEKNNQIFLTLLLCYVGLVIFVVFCVHILVHVYALLPHSPLPHIVITQAFQHLLSTIPKPGENFVFLSSCFLVPIIASLLITYIARGASHFSSQYYVEFVIRFLLVVMTMIAFFTLYGSDLILVLSDYHEQSCSIFGVIIFFLIWRYDLSKSVTNQKYRWASWYVLFALFILISLAFRIFSPGIAYLTISVDAPLYSISQAVAGKLPLVDFPTQYGNYSVFIGPILYFLGARSLFALTVLLSSLLLLAYAAIFYVLHKELRYTPLFLLTGLALLLVNTNAFVYVLQSPIYSPYDPYFQYSPIRFFWPCISILVFYLYAKKPSLVKSMLFSFVSAIAIIWNLDTGIPIAGAFLAFLLLRNLFCLTDQKRSWGRRKDEIYSILLRFILHIFIISFCIAAFFYGIFLKSGGPIHYGLIDKYQHILYHMGYCMLPLPLHLHTWMLVVALYLF